MQIVMNIFLLLLGFVLLIQSAKVFVAASVAIARRLKIPTMVIGLTVVAMGTSAPEVVISVSAAIGGSGDLAIANVVGANIFNLLFIVGFCALIYPISVKMKTISRDYWASVAFTVLLLVMVIAFGDAIPRAAGLVLLLGFTGYMTIVVRGALKSKAAQEEEEDGTSKKVRPLWQNIALAVLGIAVIIGAGQLTVSSAVSIATVIGISERVIGLTIVAAGTSLPELITTLIACRKKEGEFAVGFIIGSSIFNIAFVLGLSGLIMPLAIDPGVIFDMAVLAAGTLTFFLFAKSSERVVRVEGLAMMLIYLGYMTWVVVNP
ncbi:MAG: calcium/sodium antiporter [Clostridiales bacterium]|jgi:cation:H+ antiporter|nr:calcium/sodium antiporter [Clostridiales bacterium]